jgi:hypothetical protein
MATSPPSNENRVFGRWSFNNPGRANLTFGIVGVLLLLLYAILWARDTPVSIFDLLILEVSGTKVLAVLLKELGLALLIAVLINLSIEGFNRQRHQLEKQDLIDSINLAHDRQRQEQIRAINEKMFQTVYERNIPPQLFREVEDKLLRTNFVREWSEYDIVISRHDAQFAKVTMLHRYSIRNISGASSEHTLRLGLDVIPSKASEFNITRVCIGGIDYLKDQISIQKEVKSPVEEWWTVSTTCQIANEQSVLFAVEFERLSSITGKEVLCTLLPTVAMTVRVTDKDEIFAVRGMSLHPQREVLISGGDGKSVLSAWKVDGSLFPGQGFLVSWMLRDAGDADSVSSQSETFA